LLLTQNAKIIGGELVNHNYEGVALDLDERPRLVADLGTKHIMLLRNHVPVPIVARHGSMATLAPSPVHFSFGNSTGSIRVTRNSHEAIFGSRTGDVFSQSSFLKSHFFFKKLDKSSSKSCSPHWAGPLGHMT
jgi:hypothetical protein